MTRGNHERLTVLTIGLALGALAGALLYHVSLTGAGLLGAGTRR